MMNSKEFKRIYHPKLGRYVYAHRGNGLIVDNVLKPIQRKAKEFGKAVVKPFLKKKAKETISKAGERLGQKAIKKWTQKTKQSLEENAGDLIRHRLDRQQRNGKQRNGRQTNGKKRQRQSQTEDANAFLNNLIAMS